MSTLTTRQARERRHRRIRGKVAGTAERPRLAVFRSNKGIFAQLIDDENGRTVAGASWLGLAKSFKGNRIEQAEAVGKAVADAVELLLVTGELEQGERIAPRKASLNTAGNIHARSNSRIGF